MIRDEWLTEDRRYWLDNFKRLRDDKMKLIEQNKELNEFINHVKELSNYHERKKLEYKEENEQLKQRINNLVSENTTLQNDLFTDQLQTDELEYKLLQRQTEITELKTKLYDATVKEQRLIKILKETSY